MGVKVKVKSLSHVQLFVNPWTVAHQAPLSIGFSRQEYWSGLPCPSPGDLPNPGIKPRSPALQADALTSEPAKGVSDGLQDVGRRENGRKLTLCLLIHLLTLPPPPPGKTPAFFSFLFL